MTRKPGKAKAFQPPAALDLDATAAKLYEDVDAAAARSGLEVVLLVAASNGDWRGRWGAMPLDRAVWYVFRLLTNLQRMLP
jgi:hypothetical protein